MLEPEPAEYFSNLFCGLDTGEYSYGRRVDFIFHRKEIIVTKRKIDVMDKDGKVLHTYPITIAVSDPWPKDAEYEKAALSAAKVAKLVPESEFASLKTRLQ
jgi:hypothetical protein